MNCVTLNQLQYIVKEKDTTIWEPIVGGNGGFSVSVLQTLNSPRQVVILSATLDGIAIDIQGTATSGSFKRLFLNYGIRKMPQNPSKPSKPK